MKSTAREHDISRPGTAKFSRTCAKFDIKQIHRLIFPWRCGLSPVRTGMAEFDDVDAILGDGVQGAGQQNCVLRACQQLGEVE